MIAMTRIVQHGKVPLLEGLCALEPKQQQAFAELSCAALCFASATGSNHEERTEPCARPLAGGSTVGIWSYSRFPDDGSGLDVEPHLSSVEPQFLR